MGVGVGFLAIFCVVFIHFASGCLTPTDHKIYNVRFKNVTGVFKFHLKNASQLSKYNLTVVLSWDVEGTDYDGFLYQFIDNHSESRKRKKRFALPPPPIAPPPLVTSSCDNIRDNLWTVAKNDTSIQCQIPCDGILPAPCAYSTLCNYLSNGYRSLSRNMRSVELPVRFGSTYDLTILPYAGWYIGREEHFEVDEDVVFCRHELITKYGVDVERADDFCKHEQMIEKNTHTTGPISSFNFSKIYRDMKVNRGLVVLEWKDPHDTFPDATLEYYSLSSNGGVEDESKIYVSEKAEDGFYRVAVRNIEFEKRLTVQIIPVSDVANCSGCTSYGLASLKSYEFSDIDACEGDSTTPPYCDEKANCTDLPSTENQAAICACPTGYAGNGVNTEYSHGEGCLDFDSCSHGGGRNETCDPNAACTDLEPPSFGFTCACRDDYIGDGYRSGSGCKSRSLVIGLVVGLVGFLLILTAGLIVLKCRQLKKRERDKIMSHFLPTADIAYTASVLTPDILKNGNATDSAGAFGQKWELDRNAVELKGIVGRGNFGVVHRATLAVEGEEILVAVKMTPENPSESLRTAFLAEISIIVNIGSHENLIGMIGCCTTGDQPMYLVSQYMKYGDLLHFLWNAREERNCIMDPIYSITELSLYHIAGQVACGMKYLADIKVIHGDIAARNILVGEGLKCKISDFGLANDVYRYGMIKGATEKTVPLKWVSPERMMGGKVPITWRSDVWSFGILLYETVTLGASPYPDIPTDDIKEKVQSGYRMEKPQSCSQYLYDIMLKCWEWTPSKRPSFKQLEADLKSLRSRDNETYVNLYTMVPTLGTERNGSSQRNGYANDTQFQNGDSVA